MRLHQSPLTPRPNQPSLPNSLPQFWLTALKETNFAYGQGINPHTGLSNRQKMNWNWTDVAEFGSRPLTLPALSETSKLERQQSKMTRLATTIKAALVLLLTVIGCSGNSTDPVSSDATLAKSSDASETYGFGSEFGQRALGPIGEVLELSDTQKEQIKAILQQHRESFRGHGREYKKDMSFEERRAQRQATHACLRDEIFTVLTAEQRAKAEALKAQLDNGQMPEEIIGKRLDRLREKLHLADEQVAQLKALDTWNTLRQDRENSDGQREFHKQRNAFHEEYEKQMLNILTPEQQTLFAEMKAQRREQMKRRFHKFGEKPAQRRIEHLTDALGLDEAQQAQLEEIFANLRANFEEELQQGSGRRNRDRMRQAMHDKMSEVDERTRAILTAEQLQKYEELKAEHGKRRGGGF